MTYGEVRGWEALSLSKPNLRVYELNGVA